ncbi:alpha/beta hydrolase [Azorhizobium oxalatiphilum]|uniref:Alpha/beta hydrolase n=1 Tax=Azorhizobium oxalatiphilum TaxID=980631 RepID=A0A917FKC5_9HYPH|nr:alpha/beta hydrolase [Azorhizobium oxalatiphilum]GGF86300.1 alpha/beta hydrolase [Azorhizobium oxalatiphilum]
MMPPPSIPVAFDGCAAMLHPARRPGLSGRAVIICETFGYEALATQRAMLTLAELCAADGLTVLRFHYPGTGDSAREEEPGQIDRWIDSIGAAARYLKDSHGVAEVALCGYRLGALLAIEAAQRFGDICALALLAPVLAGRAFAREQILSGAMLPFPEGSVPCDWKEILGYRLHATDIERLRSMDQRATRGAGSARRVLLVSPEEWPDDLPSGVDYLPFQHFDGLMQHAADIVIPVRVFESCAAWLRRGAPPAPAHRPLPGEPSQLQVAPGLSETRMHFGADGSCFGVLTHAANGRRDRAVLILNAGLNLHTGNGRGSVRLARRLAAAGIGVLRMDFGRIGEAAPTDPAELVRYHDLGRLADIRAALDLLAAAGYGRVVLTGICAGAYMGLHAAAAGDPRVSGAVLVNLPYFYIRDEDPSIPLWRRPLALALHLLARTRNWWANHGLDHRPDDRPMLGPAYFRRRYVAGRLLLVLHYGQLALKLKLIAALNRLSGRDWLASHEERLVAAVKAAGVPLTLVYSRDDWGLVELGIVFAEQGRRLLERGLADLRIVDGSDHTMTSRWMQDLYVAILEEKVSGPTDGDGLSRTQRTPAASHGNAPFTPAGAPTAPR